MKKRDWIGRAAQRLEGSTLAALLLVLGAVWGFIELADAVVEGEAHAIDEALLLMLRTPTDLSDPIGPAWVEEMSRDFTALGGVGVLTLLTLAAAGFVWLQAKRRAAFLVLAAIGSGLLLSVVLKQGFDRPRPDLVPFESLVYTASFPSGHSTMAAVTYLTLAALLAGVQQRLSLKIYFFALALLLTTLVGVSRVYLGVHWPTDVLAGWTVGAGWALLFWTTARWLQQHGNLD